MSLTLVDLDLDLASSYLGNSAAPLYLTKDLEDFAVRRCKHGESAAVPLASVFPTHFVLCRASCDLVQTLQESLPPFFSGALEFVIADATKADCPIVYVSDSFIKVRRRPDARASGHNVIVIRTAIVFSGPALPP